MFSFHCARWLTLSFLIAMISTNAQSQSLPPNRSLDERFLASIPESTRERYYKEREDSLRTLVPRIIFVPGVLGSKIEECQADGSQCKSVWGTIEAFGSRRDLTRKADRKYRTDVAEEIVFKDIYGSVLELIRLKARDLVEDRSSDAVLNVFHYDWRVSNAENAELLAKRICEIRISAPESPITVIAHSMGGLITKVWAKRFSSAECGSAGKPMVKTFVFVATPHLGSPKTIKAITTGYSILFDEISMVERVLPYWARWFEREHLLKNLNEAGVTFPSFYELLPIQSSEWCRTEKPSLADLDIIPSSIVGENGKTINVFDAAKWREYDLLRRIGNSPLRNSFYMNQLPTLLKNAELLLCELVDFDPASVAEVRYFYGREKNDNTLGLFKLRPASSDLIIATEKTAGDGTVPVYSAGNAILRVQAAELALDHVSIISSSAIAELVGDWFEAADTMSKAMMKRADADFEPVVVAEVAMTGNLLSLSLDPRLWSDLDQQTAIAINTQALKLMDYSPPQVAELASATVDANERAKLYAIAASAAPSDAERVKWTGELALASYNSGNYEEAISASDEVLRLASDALAGDNLVRFTLETQAKSVNAWANLKVGNFDEYKALVSADSTLKEPSPPLFALGNSAVNAQGNTVFYYATKDSNNVWVYGMPPEFGPEFRQPGDPWRRLN
jgi:Lecithin:cholesterol acyltransferase